MLSKIILRSRTVLALFALALAGPAMAADGVLRILTNADQRVIDALGAAFEEQTGVRVEAVRVRAPDGDVDGALLRRAEQGGVEVALLSAPPEAAHLAEHGALAAHSGPMADAWPDFLRDEGSHWFAFGERTRVLVYRQDEPVYVDLNKTIPPLQVRDVWNPSFSKGVLVMGQPDAGPMRAQLAALLALWGEDEYRRWIAQTLRQRVRLIEDETQGPALVSQQRAVGALCDSSAAFAANAGGARLEIIPLDHSRFDLRGQLVEEIGPVFVAHAIGLTRAGAGDDDASAFIEFALSERADRILAEMDASHVPVYEAVRADHPELVPIKQPAAVSVEQIIQHADRAVELFREQAPG